MNLGFDFKNILGINTNKYTKSFIKIFSLLIISTIIVHLAAWGLNWKFGHNWHIHSKTISYSDLLSPIKDLSYFEHFQYILLLWCGTLSFYWSINSRRFKTISISLIYFFLFIDDSIGIHDRIIRSNEIINNYFSKFNYIILEKINISDNLAEYSYWIIVLAISLLISLPGFLSSSKTTRRFMIVNFILFLLLSFFAIFVDFIGINWDKWFKINLTSLDYFIRVSIEIIEECGELGIISLSCIWLFALNFPAKIKTP